MKLIKQIREQPLHIRKAFMWTLVVVTFSFVGVMWFQTTQKNFVALLHPQDAAQQQAEADTALAAKEKTDEVASPFAVAKKAWSSLTANVSGIFSNNNTEEKERNITTPRPVPPQTLPVE